MHKIFLVALSAAVCLYFSGCKAKDNEELGHHHHHTHQHEPHDHENGHNHKHEHEQSGHDEHEEDSEDEITLKPSIAERFGVETETVEAAPFTDALKVSGEILAAPSDVAVIVAPTAGILNFVSGIDRGVKVNVGSKIASITASGVSGGDQNLAARAAFDAAKRELDRLKPLYEERLVTASEYNAALRTYEEAKAGYSSVAQSGVITSPISGVIISIDAIKGQYVEVGTPIATISSTSRLTLRADVPQRYFNRVKGFKDALVKMPYSDKSVMLGELNGTRTSAGATVATTTPGYIPVYFSFDNDGSFVPGSNADVYLQSSEDDNIISVPLTALSEQQGLYYVFVRLDEECYRKVPVKTGRNNGVRIEILSGLTPGDNVVVKGTTTVRIAESSGAVPEGHSHNH
ncbi:MAG: efflux RND transporter periplasmic adaptor subunit [Muribaculaceae bacterium]|nr:efflux RND transporter periplasmic adaptor subunit [Muribaculaceae bacterium]